MESLKLLAVFAHPDDESMGMGGTLAKYSAEGVDTHLVCASRGERGWFGLEEENPGLERLGQTRTVELQNAVNTLGMKSLNFLDYIDGDVDKANHIEAIGKIPCEIHTELIEGSAAEAIIDVANTRKSNVIVMGSRGLGKLAGATVGAMRNAALTGGAIFFEEN